MCIVSQARAQKPKFCECHCGSTASTGDENNTAKAASCCECTPRTARLERHPVQAYCAAQSVLAVRCGKKEGLSARLKFFQNLLIHFQDLIPPTIFSPIISPPSFISLHHACSSFPFDLPLLFYSLHEASEFCVCPNSMVGLQITWFTRPQSGRFYKGEALVKMLFKKPQMGFLVKAK